MLFRLAILLVVLVALPARAATLADLAAQLSGGGYDDRARVIAAIAATGDLRATRLLEALAEGDLRAMKVDGRIIRVAREGRRERSACAVDVRPC